MEIIQISGYMLDEKEAIARNYRIPKNVASHGLDGRMTWGSDAVRRVILDYTREAGVRELDRMIAKVSRKAAKQYLDEPWKGTWELGAQDVRRLLGVPPYREDQASKEPAIGRSHGLAWTSVGGVTLDVEAVSVPGSGKVALTGQLGEVMKESAQAAIAYLRANADTYGLPEGFYETRDVHVHVLEGAVPKDGPSAGIAIASAVASALTQTPLRGDVAMTGEITLQGRVLPIGGVKEKLLAAHQAGIPHVLIPHENQANLEDVPDAVLNDLTVTLVKDFAEVLTAVTEAGTEAFTAPEAPNQTAPGASV
jgi:ATP-dependent Lon protease